MSWRSSTILAATSDLPATWSTERSGRAGTAETRQRRAGAPLWRRKRRPAIGPVPAVSDRRALRSSWRREGWLPTATLGRVRETHADEAGVDAEPAQRLRLPTRGAVADPGQRHELARPAEHEVGDGPPGQVRGRHAVAHVAAGPGDPRRPVESDRGEPVSRHGDRAPPAMGDPCVGQGREQLD